MPAFRSDGMGEVFVMCRLCRRAVAESERVALTITERERDEARARVRELELERRQTDQDWANLMEQIAIQVGDDDEHDSADAGDPAFLEQFDPWECLRQAGPLREQLEKAEQLRAENERLRECLRGLWDDGWITDVHLDGCPEDDTCDCPWPAEINAVLDAPKEKR